MVLDSVVWRDGSCDKQKLVCDGVLLSWEYKYLSCLWSLNLQICHFYVLIMYTYRGRWDIDCMCFGFYVGVSLIYQ